ncbi:MAG: hypothetical protein QUV05_07090 [Phycisphaerae bacterium]|nr:hypothetical protein [Phycisphaerae bacterium]
MKKPNANLDLPYALQALERMQDPFKAINRNLQALERMQDPFKDLRAALVAFEQTPDPFRGLRETLDAVERMHLRLQDLIASDQESGVVVATSESTGLRTTAWSEGVLATTPEFGEGCSDVTVEVGTVRAAESAPPLPQTSLKDLVNEVSQHLSVPLEDGRVASAELVAAIDSLRRDVVAANGNRSPWYLTELLLPLLVTVLGGLLCIYLNRLLDRVIDEQQQTTLRSAETVIVKAAKSAIDVETLRLVRRDGVRVYQDRLLRGRTLHRLREGQVVVFVKKSRRSCLVAFGDPTTGDVVRGWVRSKWLMPLVRLP